MGDFAPHAGMSSVLHYAGHNLLKTGEWGITLTDKNANDYLGEHHLEKTPRGVILLGACKADEVDWRSVLSHEVLELLMDASASLCEELDDGTLLAYEACDPCEGAAGAYEIDGVPMEDFVLPLGYFKGLGSKYDFRGVLTAPRGEKLAHGGYQLIRRPGQGWDQIQAAHVRGAKRKENIATWSRRGRRIARDEKVMPPLAPKAA